MRLIAFVLMAMALAGAAHGQDAWPSRQITLIAPYAAGGSTDLVGRVLAEGLKARLGQPVTVDNKPGGNGVPGTREVVKANPDGYTLLIGALGAQVLPAVMAPNFPFDPLRDFVPVSLVAEWAPVMLVKKALPPSSLGEFIAYAKTRPGALNFGTSGYGSTVHLVAEIMMRQAGIKMQHVPYRGAPPALTDVIAGQVDVMFDNMPSSIGHIRAERLRPLGVSTTTRLAVLPDVPTIAESVPGFETGAFAGLGAPRGTPGEIIAILNREVTAGLADATLKARIIDLGGMPLPQSPAEFGKLVADETEKWGKVVKASGAKAN